MDHEKKNSVQSKDTFTIRKAVLKCYLLLSIAILFTMAATPAIAAGESHESEHAFHRHHASLIVANTFDGHGENGLSVGGDYEYRLNDWFGLGVGVEYAGGDFGHILIGVPLFIHPYGQWRLAVTAGGEIYKDEEEHKTKREWLIRTGVGYQFPLGKGYSISPEFYVDFSEHETLYVIGLAIGFGW